MQTVAQFISAEHAAGRFPSMPIDGAAGRFWLCDSDWRPLSGRHYDSFQAAEVARSKALDKAKSTGPRDFDEIDQNAPFLPMTAEIDPEA